MKAWAAWTAGVALVAAAWGVSAATPPTDAKEAPFTTTTQIGHPGLGRNIAVTVTGVRRAKTVTAGGWRASGNWLIVDLDAAAVRTERAAVLGRATYTQNGMTFSASERPPVSLRGIPLRVGIPQSGSVAFELPENMRGGSGMLSFSLSTDDRLDSVIDVPVSLGDKAVQNEAALRTNGWAAS